MQTEKSPTPISDSFLPFPNPESGEPERPLTAPEKHLQALLLEGIASGPGPVLDAAYFDGLRERIQRRALARG